jgi:surface protein
MFANCTALTSLDVSNFNTSNVTQMNSDFSGLFDTCKNLTIIKGLENLNTSNVSSFANMFRSCSSLTSLDVSNFDTSNATCMASMFANCPSLTNLDVSNFDTSKVKDMVSMFKGCSSLTSLDVSNFDTSSISSTCSSYGISGYQYMFQNCQSLTNLDVSGFNTSGLTDLRAMFDGCSSLTSLDVSGFDTSNVTQMGSMFRNCSSLTELDLSNWSSESLVNYNYGISTDTYIYGVNYLFSGCSSLQTIYTSELFDLTGMSCYRGIFTSCDSLVGGAGTCYISSNNSYAYGHIDTADNPGYFTQK